MNTETFTTLDWYEIQDLVKEHLGEDYDYHDFASDLESNNDSNHIFDPRIREYGSGDMKVKMGWRRWITAYDPTSEFSYYNRPQYFLGRLIEAGAIPADHRILVNVSW